MMLLHSLRRSVRRTAGRLAMTSVAGLLVAVGIGFLTAALWMLIAATHGAMMAATIIGGLYVGVGLIMIAVAMPDRSRHHHHHTPAVDPTALMMAQIAEGFVTGMRAGRATRR